MIRTLAIPFILLTGCNATAISEKEAERIFRTVLDVSDDVLEVTIQGVRAAKDVDVDASEDGWTVAGTIEGGEDWEGTVDLDGGVSHPENGYEATLDSGYDDVTHDEQGVTLDGELSMYAVYMEDDVSVYTGFELEGDFEVSGDAHGEAEIDIGVEFYANAATLEVSASAWGEISGHDVDGWADGL